MSVQSVFMNKVNLVFAQTAKYRWLPAAQYVAIPLLVNIFIQKSRKNRQCEIWGEHGEACLV